MKATTLDLSVNAPSPDFTSIMTELHLLVMKTVGEKPNQTDLSASLMDDGSAIVSVDLAFPSGRRYKGMGSGMNYDAALRSAYEDVATQIKKSPAAEILEEDGYGHGV